MLRLKFKSRINSKLLSEFVPSGVTTKGSKKTVTIGGQRFKVVPANEQAINDIREFINKATGRSTDPLKSLMVYRREDFAAEFGNLLNEAKKEKTSEEASQKETKKVLFDFAKARIKGEPKRTETVERNIRKKAGEDEELANKYIEYIPKIQAIEDPQSLLKFMQSEFPEFRTTSHAIVEPDTEGRYEGGFYKQIPMKTPETPEEVFDTAKKGLVSVSGKDVQPYIILVPESVVENLENAIRDLRDESVETVKSMQKPGENRETRIRSGHYTEIKDWYADVNELFGILIKEIGTERDPDKSKGLLGLFASFFSLNSTWTQNLAEAIGLFAGVNRDLKEGKRKQLEDFLYYVRETHGMTKDRKGNIVEKDFYTNPFTKPKTTNFFLNTSDVDIAKRPESGEHNTWWNTTQDRWMLRAFYWSLKLKGKEIDTQKLFAKQHYHDYLQALTKRIADNLGLQIQEVQALLWVMSMEEKEGRFDSHASCIRRALVGVTRTKDEVIEYLKGEKQVNKGLITTSKDKLKGLHGEITKIVQNAKNPTDFVRIISNMDPTQSKVGAGEYVKAVFEDYLKNDNLSSIRSEDLKKYNDPTGKLGNYWEISNVGHEKDENKEYVLDKEGNRIPLTPNVYKDFFHAKKFIEEKGLSDFTGLYTFLAYITINPKASKIPPVLKGLENYVKDSGEVSFEKLVDKATESFKGFTRSKAYKKVEELNESKKPKRKLKVFLKSLR